MVHAQVCLDQVVVVVKITKFPSPGHRTSAAPLGLSQALQLLQAAQPRSFRVFSIGREVALAVCLTKSGHCIRQKHRETTARVYGRFGPRAGVFHKKL